MHHNFFEERLKTRNICTSWSEAVSMCCCLCMYINKGRVLKPRVYFRSLSVSWSSLSVVSLVISVTFCQSCCESLHLYIWPPYHPVCLCCPCCFLLCFCLYSVWKHLLSVSRSHVWCIMSLFSPRDTVFVMKWRKNASFMCLSSCSTVWELLWL